MEAAEIELAGIEPTVSWSQTRRATKLRYSSEKRVQVLPLARRLMRPPGRNAAPSRPHNLKAFLFVDNVRNGTFRHTVFFA